LLASAAVVDSSQVAASIVGKTLVEKAAHEDHQHDAEKNSAAASAQAAALLAVSVTPQPTDAAVTTATAAEANSATTVTVQAAQGSLPGTTPVGNGQSGAKPAVATGGQSFASALGTAVSAAVATDSSTAATPPLGAGATPAPTTSSAAAASATSPMAAAKANFTSALPPALEPNLNATPASAIEQALANSALLPPSASLSAVVGTTVVQAVAANHGEPASNPPVAGTQSSNSGDPSVNPANSINASDASAQSSATSQPNNASGPATNNVATPVAGGLASQATLPSGTSRGTSEVERVRFVQRVARAFQSVGDQGGTIRLRLSPPELGSVRMEIRMDHGQMSAHLEAETPEAQSMLLNNLPALRDRLAQQDITVASFDVGLMGQTSGGSPQPKQNNDGGDLSGRTASTNQTEATAAVTGSSTASAAGTIQSDGRLNVLI
jgi:flagellar hook-length control protein FliK